MSTIFHEFTDFVDAAIAEWVPKPTYSVLKQFGEGKSGALVYLIDILPEPAPERSTDALSGTFVLKLDKKGPWSRTELTEVERHSIAQELNPDFAHRHIPTLLRFKEDKSYTAALYTIASYSLKNIISASNVDAGTFQQRASDLSYSLLAELNKTYQVEMAVAASTSLTDWLGYRLVPTEASRLHSFFNSETGTQRIFPLGGRLLVNPLWLSTSALVRSDSTQARFVGLIHGDLHSENVLIDRFHQNHYNNFWLIDWGLSRKAPLFFDQAYFEVSLLLRHLVGSEPERILNLYDALEELTVGAESFRVPIGDVGVVNCIQSIRKSVSRWQQEYESYRPDAVQSQYLLSLIAASLNWANKPLPDPDRRLALAAGSWCATKYLKVFHEGELQSLFRELESPRLSESNQILRDPIEDGERQHWQELWTSMNSFNPANVKFVLISGLTGVNEDYASLGFIPWSAVIDFDPESNDGGLFSRVFEVLETHRSIKQFGLQFQAVNFDRATAWLMANGWASRSEDPPTDIRAWRQTYTPHIRTFAEHIRIANAPHAIKVLVVPGPNLNGSKLERVLETIDIELREFGRVTLLGEEHIEDESLVSTQIPLNPDVLARELRGIFGSKGEANASYLPGADGPVPVGVDRLRNLEEDLDILHSALLVDSSAEIKDETGFLRGAPPTWMDLHIGSDIERRIHDELVLRLEEMLQESRNRTLELHHSPGAGGTTSALRAAWALRNNHPTAVLRRASKLTLDRLDELFHLAQRPVLLVAEASILSPQQLEDLLRGLGDRNARAVILYVQRTLDPNDTHPIHLITPMGEAEAREFFTVFSAQTKDSRRIERLREMSFVQDSPLASYRSPFFYGLTTFESEFTSVNRYVQAFLRDAPYSVKKVVKFGALVTRFAQNGMERALFNRLLGLEADSTASLELAIGAGPSQLFIQYGSKIKLMHPLIAEEALRQLLGTATADDWRHGLKDLSIEFVREVVGILGSDSEETNDLFEQLFIRRGEWFIKRERRNFAEIINLIPTIAGQHQVLEFLTQTCPSNPHYWNHLGRHHIYEMKQDFARAEEYLKKAVELEPGNSIHHHSLGMVRRFWIGDILQTMVRSSPVDADSVLDEVEGLVESAALTFEESRRLSPQEAYGYITHIQLILSVAERLISSLGGKQTVAEIKASPKVSSWLRSNLVIAEELITHVQHLRADKEPNSYELKCINRLNAIYGNFDETIAAWQALLEKESGQVDLRRAIAQALHSKNKRRWDLLDKVELQRIVDLMEDNLREDPTNEADIRMWFQAYKRLPEFSYLHALDRLETWALNNESVDAYYYLYVLHFLLWYQDRERNEFQIEDKLERSRQLAIGKRGHSYEWLGIGPEWCPLVSYHELGEFDRQVSFYSKTDGLAYCNGTIEVIKGPKAGTIRLGKTTRAFFVPGSKFRASHDINAIVHFYVGFSYDGLRAWAVDFGAAPTAKSVTTEMEVGMEETPAKVSTREPKRPDSWKLPSAHKDLSLTRDRIREVVLRELAATPSVLLSHLGGKLKAIFGRKSVHQALGYETLEQLLASYDEFALTGPLKSRSVVRDSGQPPFVDA